MDSREMKMIQQKELLEFWDQCQQASEEKLSSPEWIQRNLEDQINEEIHKANKKLLAPLREMADKLEKKYNMGTELEVPVNSRRVAAVTQRIKPSEVLDLLKKGYTRLAKDDLGYGSIQDKYNLSALAVKRLFKTPMLKNKKTKVPDFILDESDEVEKLIEETEAQDAIPESPLFS